jgi:MFS family permease
MGVPWFVLQSTGSAAKAGIVAFCTLLPAVLAALVTGPVIDRMGRRRVSVASDLACGVAVAAIPLLQFTGILQFWMLCVLMAMTGLFRSPGETARGVLLPTLAERAGMPLTRAAGLYDGAARCAALTGSALGGVLIAVLGAQNVLLVDAATFAVSAPLFAFGVRGLPEAQAQRQVEPASLRAYRRELAEGYRFVAATPLLLGLCLMTLVTRGLDQGWSAVLLPMHAREELDGAVDLGLLKAAFGVCALTGALVYGALGSRFRRWPVFTIAFLIGGLPRFVVAAFTDTFAPLAVIMAVEGLAFGVLNPIMATVTYEEVVEYLAGQLGIEDTSCVKRYAERRRTPYEHAREIQERFSYRDFNDRRWGREFRSFLYGRAWTHAEGRWRCSTTRWRGCAGTVCCCRASRYWPGRCPRPVRRPSGACTRRWHGPQTGPIPRLRKRWRHCLTCRRASGSRSWSGCAPRR